MIIYEQPLNEYTRICLRLECLFARLDYSLKKSDYWHHKQAVINLLEILAVIDRPDLKSKLTQALTNHAASLAQLEKIAGVDHVKLGSYLKDLDNAIDYLYANQEKLGTRLRENAFLQAIRPHLLNPGGVCAYNVPTFELWLQNENYAHDALIREWFDDFAMLKNISSLLLELTRGSKKLENKSAENGFYQQNLDPASPAHLLRLAVKKTFKVFPEISVGRHRLSIHFYELDLSHRSAQANQHIPFQLACCNL